MNKYDVIIAIDVGINGGIAFFDVETSEVLALYEMPTKIDTVSGKEKRVLDIKMLDFVLEIPKEHNDDALVVLENIHAFPGQGVVAVGTLLEQKGVIRGIARALGYAELLIEPKAWQKYFSLIPPKEIKGKSASQTKTLRKKWLKENSLSIARDLFPEWKGTKLASKDAHGLSDALLIGRYSLGDE